MKLNEFQELSKRTMPYNGAPANQTEFENMLGNYAMGLVGEAVEAMSSYMNISNNLISTEELIKELGDVAHYAVGIANIFKIEFEKEIEPGNYSRIFGISELVFDLVSEAGLIVEHVKKVIYHRHEIDVREIAIRLEEIFKLIADIAEDEGYELSEVFQMNIDKLKTRYPEKFNTTDSINRVDMASE